MKSWTTKTNTALILNSLQAYLIVTFVVVTGYLNKCIIQWYMWFGFYNACGFSVLLNCIVWCVGGSNNCVNAHSLMREQLEAHLNRHRNLAQIVHLLHETYEPLISISKLPTIPQLGVNNSVSTYSSTLALIVFFSYYLIYPSIRTY